MCSLVALSTINNFATIIIKQTIHNVTTVQNSPSSMHSYTYFCLKNCHHLANDSKLVKQSVLVNRPTENVHQRTLKTFYFFTPIPNSNSSRRGQYKNVLSQTVSTAALMSMLFSKSRFTLSLTYSCRTTALTFYVTIKNFGW